MIPAVLVLGLVALFTLGVVVGFTALSATFEQADLGDDVDDDGWIFQ